MSGRIKIKSKDKDKRPKIDVFKVIENRFKNMNELRDLIDMDPRKGLVRIRDGAGFREVERGGCLHRNYLNLLEEELGAKLSIDLIERYINRYVKKPIAIEAVKWKGFNNDEIKDFAGDSVKIKVIREGDADNGIPPSVDCSIETLEGVMKANVGDYIIKGVNGEFYPCKQDIFEKTYDKADDSSVMCFGDAIEVLKQGGTVRRSGWNGKGLMVFKQVPAHIDSDIIPKMQSLPQSAKDLILKSKGFIDYTSQCLIYNENTGRADSWVPSISDVFAEDWEIVR